MGLGPGVSTFLEAVRVVVVSQASSWGVSTDTSSPGPGILCLPTRSFLGILSQEKITLLNGYQAARTSVAGPLGFREVGPAVGHEIGLSEVASCR